MTCKPGGGVVLQRNLPAAQVCDLLVLHDTGAYGASMSSNYNTRPLIPEVLVASNGQARLMRRKQTVAELIALWPRIVFNMLVSSTDDHLRNHGFVLLPGKGWRLSPAYGMNPAPDSHDLKLKVRESDNGIDLDLVRAVAPYFRVARADADAIINNSQAVVRQ